VHDTVGLENEGVPSVFVASDEFTDAAEVQAEALGLPEVRRVLVPHPIQDANDQEMASKADEAIDSLLGALTGEAD
jgi:hypothetical protein